MPNYVQLAYALSSFVREKVNESQVSDLTLTPPDEEILTLSSVLADAFESQPVLEETDGIESIILPGVASPTGQPYRFFVYPSVNDGTWYRYDIAPGNQLLSTTLESSLVLALNIDPDTGNYYLPREELPFALRNLADAIEQDSIGLYAPDEGQE